MKINCGLDVLNNIIELSEGTVYWKDREGRYLGCNARQLKVANLTSVNDIIGKTDFDLYSHPIAKQVNELDEQVIQSANTFIVEENGVDAEGQHAIYLTRKSPLIDQETGEIFGLLGTSIDITAQKISKQLTGMKTSFIQNMQHDIRTPFTGLWGLTQYLWENESDPEKKQYLNYIRQASKELFDYCDKAIAFTQTQTNYWSLADNEFDLVTMIKSVYMIEQPAALCKKLDFSYQIDSAIPALVVSNEHRWYCIALNLLSNAIKFTESGKVEISLQILNHDTVTGQALLQLIIADTGSGITPEKQNLIYLPVNRTQPSGQNKYSGLGFGLSLVKQFIAELAGTLEIDSTVGQGTSIKCLIPVKMP